MLWIIMTVLYVVALALVGYKNRNGDLFVAIMATIVEWMGITFLYALYWIGQLIYWVCTK